MDKGAEVFNRVLVVDSNYIIAGISYDSIKIYTVTGKEVFSKNISEKSTPINISNYPKGIYFYTIISDENSFLGKLILQ